MQHRACEQLSGVNTVVLCVHRIQGSPNQFEWLRRQLPADVDFLRALLPGHGATAREFCRCGAPQWLDLALSTARDLRRRYCRVYCV